MKKLTFPHFVAKFPPVAMPATLGEETHHVFGTENDPLSDELIAQFIHPTEQVVPDDEFTEYVPVLPSTTPSNSSHSFGGKPNY